MRAAIVPVSLENGSIIYESLIDYVAGTEDDIIRQLREAYGDMPTSLRYIQSIEE